MINQIIVHPAALMHDTLNVRLEEKFNDGRILFSFEYCYIYEVFLFCIICM